MLFADEEGEWGGGDEAVIVSSSSCFRVGVTYLVKSGILFIVEERRKNRYSVETKSALGREKMIECL